MAKNHKLKYFPKYRLIFLLILLTISTFFLLSYRITDTPMGLTADEAAFGWNAVLLSRTGLDENGAHFPIFVNSLNKKDWRQPWTQYYLVLFFKIFGASIYNLRISSVFLVLFCALLLFKLSNYLLSPGFGFVSYLLFITTPIIFMHSHLGLDNIMPLPFALVWLIFIYLYSKNNKTIYLIIAGLSLGASFYSYKGMRATVPVWSSLTCLYLLYLNYRPKIKYIKLFTSILPFALSILPFFLIIPYLSHVYPGSIFGGARPKFDNIYDFFYPYLSHYDLTFLFIKGDDLLFHSTRFHGMVLLSTLPLFFIGLYQSIRRKNFWTFISIAFFTGPLLYGFVESVHRASRIISLVPMYILICTLGFKTLFENSKLLRLSIIIWFTVAFLNFQDFTKYYWYTYPKFTENIFGNMKSNATYQEFSKLTTQLKLTPYIHHDVYDGFIAAIHFPAPVAQLSGDSIPPSGSIYLTFHDKLPNMIRLDVKIPLYNIFIRP
jgi:4-amino-4-deoxy-L-arabinose transferase-like glycosyltransferase